MPEALAALDSSIALWLHAHASPGLTAVMLWVTHLHSQLAILTFTLVFAAYVARRREWPWVKAIVFAVPLGMAMNALFKEAVHRARPVFDTPIVTLHTYSFPSGHTAAATLFYGVLAAYVVARTKRRAVRAAVAGGAVFMVALVAFTRLYLGAHYLTDVVGAAAWSLLWLALVLSLALRRGKRRRPLP
jgi:membrane-associated phospholipid phosphatase